MEDLIDYHQNASRTQSHVKKGFDRVKEQSGPAKGGKGCQSALFQTASVRPYKNLHSLDKPAKAAR